MSGSLTNRDPVEAPAGIQIKPKANAKSNLAQSVRLKFYLKIYTHTKVYFCCCKTAPTQISLQSKLLKFFEL